MALKPCRECGKQVSTEATKCPHCDKPLVVPDAVRKRTNYFNVASAFFKVLVLIPGLFLAVIVLIFIDHWNQDDTAEVPAATASATPPSALLQESSAPVAGIAVQTATSVTSAAGVRTNPKVNCTAHYTDCKDNSDLVNNYGKIGEIQAACQYATNDHVRYGNPDWPWLPFDSFFAGKDDVQTGVVRLLETNVQIQNGFGAMAHSRVVCDYDLRTGTVVLLNINGEPILLGNDALLQPTNPTGSQPNASASSPEGHLPQPAQAGMQGVMGVSSVPLSIGASVPSSDAQ